MSSSLSPSPPTGGRTVGKLFILCASQNDPLRNWIRSATTLNNQQAGEQSKETLRDTLKQGLGIVKGAEILENPIAASTSPDEIKRRLSVPSVDHPNKRSRTDDEDEGDDAQSDDDQSDDDQRDDDQGDYDQGDDNQGDDDHDHMKKDATVLQGGGILQDGIPEPEEDETLLEKTIVFEKKTVVKPRDVAKAAKLYIDAYEEWPKKPEVDIILD